MAAPYKLHGGNSTTRSLRAWNECTKRECTNSMMTRARLQVLAAFMIARGGRPVLAFEYPPEHQRVP